MTSFRESIEAVKRNEPERIAALAGALKAGDIGATIRLTMGEALALLAATDEAAGQGVGAIAPNMADLASPSPSVPMILATPSLGGVE